MKNSNRKVRLQAFCRAIEFYYQKMLKELGVKLDIPKDLKELIVTINKLDENTLNLTTMRQLYKELKKTFESQKIKIEVSGEPIPGISDENETAALIQKTPKPTHIAVPKLKVLEAIYSAEQMQKELKALELNDYQEEGDNKFAGKKRTAAEMQAFKKHFSEEKYISDMTPSAMFNWYRFAYAADSDTTAHYAVMGRKVHPHIIAYRKKLARDWANANSLALNKNLTWEEFYQECMKKDFRNLGEYLPPAVATYRDGMKGNPFSSSHVVKKGGTDDVLLIQQRSGLVVPMHMFQDKSALMPAFIKKWRYPENYQEVLEATKENILDQLRQAIIARDRHTTDSRGADFPFLLQNLMNLGNEPEGVGALTEKILLQAVAELRKELADDEKRKLLLQKMGVPNLEIKPTLDFSWQPVKTSGKIMGVLFSPLEASWRYLKIKMGVLSSERKMGVLFRTIDKWLGQGKYQLLKKPKTATATANPSTIDRMWKDYQLSSYAERFPGDTIIKAALEINMYYLAGGGASSSCKSGKDRRYAVKITADALAELYATVNEFSLTPSDSSKLFTVVINDKEWRLTAFQALEMKVAELFITKMGTLVSELNSPGAEGIKGLMDMLGKGICSRIDTIAAEKNLPHSQDGESYVKYLKESSSFNKLEMGVGKKILKWLKGDLAKNKIILSERLKEQIGVYPYHPSKALIESAEKLTKEAEELSEEAKSLKEAAEKPGNASKRERLLKEAERLEGESNAIFKEAVEAKNVEKDFSKEEKESYQPEKSAIKEKPLNSSDVALSRKTAEAISRKKVDEILKSGLSPNEAAKAQAALYKGTYRPGKESTEAREKFLAFLEKRKEDPKCPEYLEKQRPKDAKDAAVSMKALLGVEGIKLYEAAVAEERKTRAYRDAVFLASTQHIPGPKWPKRLILWIGGSSAIGKSYATNLAIRSMTEIMQKGGGEAQTGNYIVAKDGGIEREVCHMKKAALQLASDKKYSGISDVMEHTDLHIKSKVKAAADIAGLSVAIPDTFANPLKIHRKLTEMKEYAKDPTVIQGFVEIKPENSDEARQAVRLCCKIQGERRAYDANPNFDGPIDLHSDRVSTESKDYKPQYYERGYNGSREASDFFKSLSPESPGENFIIPNPIHPVFIVFEDGEYKSSHKGGVRMQAADWVNAQAAWEKEKANLLEEEKPTWLKKWIRRNVHAAKLEPKDVTKFKEWQLAQQYLRDHGNGNDYELAIKAALKAIEKSNLDEWSVYQKAVKILTELYEEQARQQSRSKLDLDQELRALIIRRRNTSELTQKDKSLLQAVAEYNLINHTDQINLSEMKDAATVQADYDSYHQEKVKAICYALLAKYKSYPEVVAQLERQGFSKLKGEIALVHTLIEPDSKMLGQIEMVDLEPSEASKTSMTAVKKEKDQDKKDAQAIVELFHQALRGNPKEIFSDKKISSLIGQVKAYVVFEIHSASDKKKEFQYYYDILMRLKQSGQGDAFYAVALALKQCVESDKTIKLKPEQKEIIDFVQKTGIEQRRWLRKNKLSIPLEILERQALAASEENIKTCLLVGDSLRETFELSRKKTDLSQGSMELKADINSLTKKINFYSKSVESLEAAVDMLLNKINDPKSENQEIKDANVNTLLAKLNTIEGDQLMFTDPVYFKGKLDLLKAKITAANYLLKASSSIEEALESAENDLQEETKSKKSDINNLTEVVCFLKQKQRLLINLKAAIKSPDVSLQPNPLYESAGDAIYDSVRSTPNTSESEKIMVGIVTQYLARASDTEREKGNLRAQPEIVQKAFAEIKKQYNLDLDHIDYKACDSEIRKAIHGLMCAVIDRLPLQSPPTDGQSAPPSKPILWPRGPELRASRPGPHENGVNPSSKPGSTF